LIMFIFTVTTIGAGCIIVDDYEYGDVDRADMSLSFSPDYVYPVYNQSAREWRWYFDWNLFERAGTGVTIDSIWIDFYTLQGVLTERSDYSNYIYSWFGTDWLPPYGTLNCSDTYWYNGDGSDEGWKARFTISGTDEWGHVVSCSAEVTCVPAGGSAVMGCSFSPNPVYPVYDYDDYEYRWYVDWSVFETAGTDVTLTDLWIDIYDLYGYHLESTDYSGWIVDWFGTNWLPGYGNLYSSGYYWRNTDGSGAGWQMRFTYYGVDARGNDVSCSGWVTMEDAYQYRSGSTEELVDQAAQPINPRHESQKETTTPSPSDRSFSHHKADHQN